MPATTLNLASLLDHQARLTPDRLAVVLRPFALTYREVNALACQVAGGLRALGFGPGDLTSIRHSPCPRVWSAICVRSNLKNKKKQETT